MSTTVVTFGEHSRLPQEQDVWDTFCEQIDIVEMIAAEGVDFRNDHVWAFDERARFWLERVRVAVKDYRIAAVFLEE